MKRIAIGIIGLIALVAIAAGCDWGTSEENRQAGNNAASEQQAVSDSFSQLVDSQQIPSFNFSQERQTVIDAETVRATGATSTALFYIEGVGLEFWCPSIGAPVPSTYQLSANESWVDIPGDESRELFNVQQGEPTGVYVGDSNATWVICLDDQGRSFGQYWEGPVGATVASVENLPADKRIQPTDIQFEFTTENG